MITKVKESECIFHLDFSKLYWNSRLQCEHDRLIQTYFKESDYVCDVFAGIGPFALPAAKNKKCFVFANDLNPSSVQYLDKNIFENKLNGKVVPFNMDGREFIKASILELNNPQLMKELETDAFWVEASEAKRKGKKYVKRPNRFYDLEKPRVFDHFVMNLPATAIDFLDAFKGNFVELLK
jgi:tRNA (guanine37-N1)-methyltransferase